MLHVSFLVLRTTSDTVSLCCCEAHSLHHAQEGLWVRCSHWPGISLCTHITTKQLCVWHRGVSLVFINGNVLGVHRQPSAFAAAMRELRRSGKIGAHTSVHEAQVPWSENEDEMLHCPLGCCHTSMAASDIISCVILRALCCTEMQLLLAYAIALG